MKKTIVVVGVIILILVWFFWPKGQNHGERKGTPPPQKVAVVKVKKVAKVKAPVAHATFDPKVCGDGTLAVINRETGKPSCVAIHVVQAPAPQPEEATAPPAPAVATKASPVQRDVCGELNLVGDKFTNKIDERGRSYCNEKVPWYKTTATKYVVGTVVVGAVIYCATTGRCWSHGGGGGGVTPTGPSGGGTGIP